MTMILVGICGFIAGCVGATVYFEIVESKYYFDEGYLKCQKEMRNVKREVK